MFVKKILRRLLLAFVLGGHDVWGVGMSKEQIEELLFAMHKPKIEVAISNDDEKSHPSKPTRPGTGTARQLGAEQVK